MFASSASDMQIVIWNTSSLSVIRSFPTGSNCSSAQLLVLPNNRHLASLAGQTGVTCDGLIKVWDFNSGTLAAILPSRLYSQQVQSALAISYLGDLVSYDGSVWDLSTFSLKLTLPVGTGATGTTAVTILPLGHLAFWGQTGGNPTGNSSFFDRYYNQRDPQTFAALAANTAAYPYYPYASNGMGFNTNGDLLVKSPFSGAVLNIHDALTGKALTSSFQTFVSPVFVKLPSGSMFV